MSDTAKKTYPQGSTQPPNRDVNASQRAALALGLRAKKLTYDEIATQLGFVDRSHARKAVQRELDRVVVSNTEELRREENYMLDQLHTMCWDMAMDKSNKGRLFAVDRVLAISERRAKLMGLDIRPDEMLANQNYTKRIILSHQETFTTEVSS